MNRIDALIQEKLGRFINNEKSSAHYRGYTLDAITTLLEAAGNPHASLRTIHIAGTNGKGSVAHMLNSIFMAAGCRTGLYTSPHLVNLRERILLDGRMVPAADFLRLLENAIDHTGKTDLSPTWFDVITFIAFSFFHEMKTDIAIIETGLGGRLDSTNLISPFVEVITSISLDHTGILGETLGEIAAEKAGIIKHGTTVVASASETPALEVLREKCRQENARLLLSGDDFAFRDPVPARGGAGHTFNFEGCGLEIRDIRLRQRGYFQLENACCAITAALAARSHGYNVTADAVRQGIARTRVPGRFSILSRYPAVIFDPAHNPGAVSSLCSSLEASFGHARFCFVIGLMKDKDFRTIVSLLGRFNGRIIYFELDDPRALGFDELRAGAGMEVSDRITRFTDPGPLEAELARETSQKRGTVVVITGSFRLYEIARYLSRALMKNCS